MKAFLVRRWWLLLLIPMILGLFRLRLDMDVLNLLPTDLPVVAGLQLYQKHFANTDELIVTLEASDAETAVATARQLALGLRAHTNLVSRVLWQPPWSEAPEQLGELLGLAWLNQPPTDFAKLARRLQPDSASAALVEARQSLATSLSPDEIARASYDPLGLSRLPEPLAEWAEQGGQSDEGFASEDGRFRLIFVNPAGKLNSYRDTARWLNQVRRATEGILETGNNSDRVRIAFTGAPAYVAETALGMERDIKWSATGTLFIIAGLFWWAHRRWRPLLSLVGLLLLVLTGTMALGGLIFGALNAVSLGFAAILLGLAVDYALVLYQEARDRPEASVTQIRRTIGPSVSWSALTTAGAFALLNFGGLPGLAQLGTLVALGILLGAVVMLFVFLPAVYKQTQATAAVTPPMTRPVPPPGPVPSRAIALTTAMLLVLVSAILYWRPPTVDHSAGALSLRQSEAESAMQSVRRLITDGGEPMWLLVAGEDEREVSRRMRQIERLALSAAGETALGNVKFPTVLWPDPDHQTGNRALGMEVASQSATLRKAVGEAGFRDEAFALAQGVLDTWARTDPLPLWPRASANLWLLEKAAARTKHGWLVAGVAQPKTNALVAWPQAAAVLAEPMATGNVWLTSWTVLGETLIQHAETRLRLLLAAILALVSLCLWLAFRSVREVLLNYAALALGFGLLLALMSLLGWTWNLMNLTAVPLMLGAGVDYGIHVQLAMRRHRGDFSAVRRTTGRALSLCAATTIVAFASLSWSSNAGLASLGLVCAAGIACVLLVCLLLLPSWWNWSIPSADEGVSAPATPSVFYRAGFWRCGLWLVRVVPAWLADCLARFAGRVYCRFNARRRKVVVQNLLPVCDGERPAAEAAARRMFEQFATKLLDLWRLEAGGRDRQPPYQWSGWEHFERARGRGRGVLGLTPHLGNWEYGGALLAANGIKLLVVTQAEPGNGFTALRQQGRSRWGVETLVVGEDPFAFVEIIKRLQAGAVVALLVDRPPPPTGVTIELFGRPFRASIAAAELARASGCALLPVYVVQDNGGYSAHVLPEITYDRAAIGNRAARIELTQEILRAFAPAIRQHLEQWYHFVPIWPADDGKQASG